MLDNIESWRVFYIFLSYPVAFMSAYLCLVNRKSKMEHFFGILYWVLTVGLIFIIISNEGISIFQGMMLGFLWATSGPLGLIVYFIRKKFTKTNNE